jgi:hypothetical protein
MVGVMLFGGILSQPAASLTDLALGLITLTLALGARGAGVHRSWQRMLSWAAAAALAGAVHHGFVTYSHTWAGRSWAVISGMVVITVSYTLAGTVHDVLGPDRGRVFWVLRSLSLGAYAVLAALGHYGIGTILICEGVTMAIILALWGVALKARLPRAPAMVTALVASTLAGCCRALPRDVTELVNLDPTSLYHLVQIPGMVLLYRALVPAVQPSRDGTSVVTNASTNSLSMVARRLRFAGGHASTARRR